MTFYFQLLILVLGATFLTAEESHEKIRVVLFLDKGAHPRNNLVKALEEAKDITFKTIDGEELREGNLKDADLLIVPGGSSKVESITMKPEGRQEVRRFVNGGGLYIGICAGCYLLTEAKSTDIGLLPLKTERHWQRGKGILPIELTPKGQEIFGVKQKMINILYHNGPVIDASHVTAASAFTPLGYYRGELVEKGGTPGLMKGTPAMFYGKFGLGLVLGISPHPEANINQVDMELNAIRWLYNHRHRHP